MVSLLGLDPGKNTGWAFVEFNSQGEKSRLEFGITLDQSLLEIEQHFQEADAIVIETFEVRPKHARAGTFDWDPMVTPQVIGAAKLLSRQLGKPIFEQNPSIKPVGYGFAGLKYVPGKKGMHAQDAIAHAFYHAVRNAGLKPVLRK